VANYVTFLSKDALDKWKGSYEALGQVKTCKGQHRVMKGKYHVKAKTCTGDCGCDDWIFAGP
jgi:hypothetical protein